MKADRRLRAYEAVDRATEIPMIVLSLVFMAVIVVPLVSHLSGATDAALTAVDWLIWAAFAAELCIKTYLYPHRVRYLKRHWYDVLIVVVPFLRPLRVLRSVRVLRELDLLRLGSVGADAASGARNALRRHGLQYVLLLVGVLIVCAAAAETFLEQGSGSTITDFGTALWWAIATVTTVGYGDLYPRTAEGRGVAALLMIVGISLFGYLTANIASFMVSMQQKDEGVTMKDLMAQLQRLEAQIAQLQETGNLSSTSER